MAIKKQYGLKSHHISPTPARPDANFVTLYFDSNNDNRLTYYQAAGDPIPVAEVADLDSYTLTNGSNATVDAARNQLLATTVQAANAISIPATTNAVTITEGTDPDRTNTVTLPTTPGEWKRIYIFNNDTLDTSGDVAVAAGNLVELIYIGGAWRKLSLGVQDLWKN